MSQHEDIVVFYRKAPTYNPQMLRVPDWREGAPDHVVNPTDIVSFRKPTGKHHHPTEKPVALLEWLIKTYTNEGDVILDATMGSGSTLVAAIGACRRCIGIEKDSDFYAVARERVKKKYLQK